MKAIKDVRLGFKDQEVLVTADIEMEKGDQDDLYFVMFNILDNPLRFVVAVAGNFVDFLEAKGYQRQELKLWLEIMQSAKERVKVTLDNQANADQARLVVTSMLAKGHFNQISTYRFPDGTEDSKLQKVPTKDMERDLGVMLEVIKDWDNFDYDNFMQKMVAKHG